MILRFYISSSSYQDVNCSVVYGSGFYSKRLNHYSVRTTDGTRNTYDLGPTISLVDILAKNVSYTHMSQLEAFLRTTILFTKNAFSIYQFRDNGSAFATGQGVDLGLGKGVTLTNVRYTKDNTEGVFKASPPDNWDIELTELEFVRT